MILSSKNKLYLTLFLMVSVLTASGFGAWFVFQLIVGENDKISRLQEELAALETQRDRTGEMTKNYDSVKSFVPELDSVLLDPNDRLKFIMLVEQLAAQTSVDHVIEAVGSLKLSANDPILFNINVSGDFTNVLKFIYSLENAPYYLNIETIQISEGNKLSVGQSGGANGGAGIVTAQMSVKVYKQ